MPCLHAPRAAHAGKRGEVAVDEYSQTSVPSIWAVGDVTDRINLTPVALMEGMALAKTIALNQPTKPDYTAVPSAVFSHPNIATVVRWQRVCAGAACMCCLVRAVRASRAPLTEAARGTAGWCRA